MTICEIKMSGKKIDLVDIGQKGDSGANNNNHNSNPAKGSSSNATVSVVPKADKNEFPIRPSHGSKGATSKVIANFFPIKPN